MTKFHPFHIVELRPWPLMASLGAFGLVRGLTSAMHLSSTIIFMSSLVASFVVAFVWWRDVTRERFSQGLHSDIVINRLKIGMILFIASEVLFFVSFFWAFFHRRMGPVVEIGGVWPPSLISPFNPLNIPLLNTIILLRRGVSVTWRHHSILVGNFRRSVLSLLLTVALGMYFTLLQAFEYIESPFCISDSVYGRCFFIATGFHGLHVIIGSIFLMVSLIRLNNVQNRMYHLIGFECAAWYWHFVDVVWLFLYTAVYWWGR